MGSCWRADCTRVAEGRGGLRGRSVKKDEEEGVERD